MATEQPPTPHPPKAEDRRVKPRVPADAETHSVSLVTGEKSVGRILNLSVGGALIQTTQPLEPKTEFSLRFNLPSQNTQIETKATVIHVQPNESMGVEFLSLKDDQQDAITEYVRRATGY